MEPEVYKMIIYYEKERRIILKHFNYKRKHLYYDNFHITKQKQKNILIII